MNRLTYIFQLIPLPLILVVSAATLYFQCYVFIGRKVCVETMLLILMILAFGEFYRKILSWELVGLFGFLVIRRVESSDGSEY